jgi:hypothetical protein
MNQKNLFERKPDHLNWQDVQAKLRQEFSEINNVHDSHVWEITSQLRCLSAHIVLEDMKLSEAHHLTDKNCGLPQAAVRDRARRYSIGMLSIAKEDFGDDKLHSCIALSLAHAVLRPRRTGASPRKKI